MCAELRLRREVLAVGDLHVENFGTWRDTEGRLIWGINDFDEACWIRTPTIWCGWRRARVWRWRRNIWRSRPGGVRGVLDGYRASLRAGGKPFVLAEHHPALREMAVARLRQPELFWTKLHALPAWRGKIPASAVREIRRALSG